LAKTELAVAGFPDLATIGLVLSDFTQLGGRLKWPTPIELQIKCASIYNCDVSSTFQDHAL
jgi:hypothetical protein